MPMTHEQAINHVLEQVACCGPWEGAPDVAALFCLLAEEQLKVVLLDSAEQLPAGGEQLWVLPVIHSIRCSAEVLRLVGEDPKAHVNAANHKALDAAIELSKWIYAGAVHEATQTVYLIKRPLYISQALHRTDGPAEIAQDGTKYWFIRGIEVDEQIVMRPETQTPEQIWGDNDLDRRMIRMERYGLHRLLSDATLLDKRDNDIEGTKEVLVQDKRVGRVLVATCPSGRVVGLMVPDTVKSCAEAQAWMHGGVNIIGRT